MIRITTGELCARWCVAAATVAVTVGWQQALADKTGQALAAAEEAYIVALEELEAMVGAQFAELIADAAEAGDIESVTDLQAQQEVFHKKGIIVEEYHLRSFRTKVRSAASAAYRDMDDAYTSAITAHTQAREFEKARAVLELRTDHREHGRLRAEAGALYLPMSHRRKPGDSGVSEPDMEPEDPAASAPAAPPGKDGLSVDFLAALNTGGERETVGDRLLPLRERQAALKKLIFRMYLQHSPMYWSAQECKLFSQFIRDSVLLFNEPCNMWWPSRFEAVGGVIFPEGEINTGGAPEQMAAVGYVQGYRAWICTAPSLKAFVERVEVAQLDDAFSGSRNSLQNINDVVKPSDLKQWFRCVGIDDFGEARAAASAWAAAGLKLTACREVAEELDVPWKQ